MADVAGGSQNADEDELLHEIFMDSDSDEETFEGFRPEDLHPRGNTNIQVDENSDISDVSDVSSDEETDSDDDPPPPTGYNHAWLGDFAENSGPKDILADISEKELFEKFITSDIIDHFVYHTGQQGVSYRRGRLPADFRLRLVPDGHYPSFNPKRKANGEPAPRDCVVCSNRQKKRHETTFMCSKCNVHLCTAPCFERYHTLTHFKIDCRKKLHGY